VVENSRHFVPVLEVEKETRIKARTRGKRLVKRGKKDRKKRGRFLLKGGFWGGGGLTAGGAPKNSKDGKKPG